MSKAAFTQYYIAGSHAVRSACEQGQQAAELAATTVVNDDLKQLSTENVALAGRFQEAFVGFLKDLGEEPNEFQDLMMKGVNDGTDMAVKAADEDEVRDVALVNGAQAGLHYYIAGFGTHAAIAKVLGHDEHAAKLKEMIDDAKALDVKYTGVGEMVVNANALSA